MSAQNVTVLRSTGPRLCKYIRCDGSIQPYNNAKTFTHEEVPVANIRDAHKLLQQLQSDPQACIIGGQYIGDERAASVIAGLPEDDRPKPDHVFRRKSFFEDRAQHLVLLDIDNATSKIDPLVDPQGAILEWIKVNLRPEFHGVSCVWQQSNSAGIKPGLRAHLWFWLKDARTAAALKAWVVGRKVPVDASVMDEVQIRYTAAPVFEQGAKDPVKQRSGFYEGLKSDEVEISISEVESASTRADEVAPAPNVLTQASESDWQKLHSIADFQPFLDSLVTNEAWSDFGHNCLSLGVKGREYFCETSAKAKSFERGAPEKWWSDHENQVPRSDWPVILTKARTLGWSALKFDDLEDCDPGQPLPASPVGTVPQAQYLCTDQRNANRLCEAYRNQLIVVDGSFYAWTGTHWAPDESIANRFGAPLSAIVREEAHGWREKYRALSAGNGLARAVEGTKRKDQSRALDNLLASENGEEIYAALMNAESLEKWARQCEMATNQANALSLLRKLLKISASELDTDPKLFNCLNGTIDLQTGKIKPHDPRNYITQLCPVEYRPDAGAPRFDRFLSEIMAGDQDRVDFLQRWFGYAATGHVSEQKMLFMIGEGANGKGVLTNVTKNVFGTYAEPAARGLLTGGGENRHPTEIADLHRRRLVLVSETGAAEELAEDLVKWLTGNDPLKARRMYGDLFSFAPSHKLQLMTNKKPIIHGQEHAMWRRLMLVKFPIKYGTAADIAAGKASTIADYGLEAALLRTEREGIFAWIVRGAVEWFKSGLRPPDSVIDEVAAYQNEQNRIGKFVEDDCTLDPDECCQCGALYAWYGVWAKRNGYRPLGSGRFFHELTAAVPQIRKIECKEMINGTRKTVRYYAGVRIDDDADGAAPYTPGAITATKAAAAFGAGNNGDLLN